MKYPRSTTSIAMRVPNRAKGRGMGIYVVYQLLWALLGEVIVEEKGKVCPFQMRILGN
jgi:hypothetical protein